MGAQAWSMLKSNNAQYDDANVVPMGLACPAMAKGDYYLYTNDAAPYGRAGNGVRIPEEYHW